MPSSTETAKETDALAAQIGKEIQRALSVKTMSVTKLHQETGISRTVLQGYLKGRYKPGARELRLLSTALDCSPNRLLFGRESFRERSYVDDLVGDSDKALNAAKISILFAILSIEEQRAVVMLLSLMAEQRMGGRDKLGEALKAADVVLSAMEAYGPGLEERIGAMIQPGELEAMAKKLGIPLSSSEEKTPPDARSEKRRTTKKPAN